LIDRLPEEVEFGNFPEVKMLDELPIGDKHKDELPKEL
jgi:hypothetical protein